MDFDLDPEQLAIQEVAQKLLGDKVTPEALRNVERHEPDRFDRAVWSAMAETGLGTAVPDEHGGAGLGLLELCLVLEEVGRRAAYVPALAVLALGALPIARFGTERQRATHLPGVASGSTVIAAA